MSTNDTFTANLSATQGFIIIWDRKAGISGPHTIREDITTQAAAEQAIADAGFQLDGDWALSMEFDGPHAEAKLAKTPQPAFNMSTSWTK